MGTTANIKLNYTPHPKQLRFHKSQAKFRALLTGIGFGKTVAGAVEMLKMAVNHPESMHAIIAPNTKIMQNATLPEFYKYARPFISVEKKSKQLIYLHNGACIIYLTADNQRHVERIRGLTLGSFWADEGRLFLGSIWNILLGRLRANTGPLKGILTTTPAGMNWHYWLFQQQKDPKTKKPLKNAIDYFWQSGTTFDNPYTPQEYKNTLKQAYAGPYAKQELYGEIVGFEGQVYSNFKHATHIITDKQLPKMKEYIFGVDWGFTNPLAAVIIGLDGDSRAYVLEEFYERQVQTDTLIAWLIDQKQKYAQLSEGYGDPSEPQFIQQFNEAGLNMYPADNEVMPGLNEVYKRFETAKDGKPRIFIHEKCKNTIQEVDTYRYKDSEEGKPQQEKPLKVNDHLMDAIRYALKTHQFDTPGYIILEDPDGTVM